MSEEKETDLQKQASLEENPCKDHIEKDPFENYVPKSDEELKELARRVLCTQTFLAVRKEEIELAFMALLMFGAKFHPEAVALYEDYSEALPRSVNGLPMFMSAKFLTRDEFERFVEFYKKFEEALK
jgi:hypothetical protein